MVSALTVTSPQEPRSEVQIARREQEMLVLGRKVNQKLEIGDDITITICRIGGSRVAIGIEAPAETRVVRSELNGKNRNKKTLPRTTTLEDTRGNIARS